mmetsp:Transcript_65127/g.146915  ORF Transcript_65127/g.146915 Transcript_65127/m.146915 type:complete len:90 (-) Transcript_65127:261-530(-)
MRVVIEDMPDVQNASALFRFTDDHVGSLQKDPAWAEANWKIAKKEDAQSISYNADLRLNNHTDQCGLLQPEAVSFKWSKDHRASHGSRC